MSDTVSVYGVHIQPKNIYTAVGRTETIQANVLPTNATNQGIQWIVRDKTVARDNGDGTFTALKAGETPITAVSDDGGYTAEAWFNSIEEKDIKVNRIVLSNSSGNDDVKKLIIGYGESEIIHARCLSNHGYDADRLGVTWTSSNSDIAVVASNGGGGSYSYGKVTARNTTGTVTITATSVASPEVHSEFTIEVRPSVVHVKSIRINPKTVEIAVGQKIQLSTIFTPSDSTNQAHTWSVPVRSTILTSSNDIITGISKGNTRLTVEAHDGGAQDAIIVKVTDGINPISKIETNLECYRFQMSTSKNSVSATSTVYVPTTPGQSATEVGLDVSVKDPSIIEVREIKAPSENSNKRVIYWNCLKPGYTTAKLTSKTDPTKTATVEIMVLKNGAGFDIYIPKTLFVVPDTIEVERGQVFTLWARGFGGEFYNYFKGYTTATLGNHVFWNHEWYGNWEFTPSCTQLEPLRQTGDTEQSYVWFRAGYIPGDYEIKVTRARPDLRGYDWPEKIVKVKIVDKLFTDEHVELIPRKYYICFKDYDKMSYSDEVQCYTNNPCEFYIGWIKEATSSKEKPTVLNANEFGWKIARDGIISKIEADGKYLKIYRGPNYGVTQVIFYLKSNPHIYYPCFVEYDGGDWRYYTTDKNLPTLATAAVPGTTSTAGNIYPGSNPLVDDQTSTEESDSTGSLPMVYKTSTYNSKYNYKSDTGLIDNKPIETKNTKKISKGSFIDPNSKRGKNGSSLI